MSREPADRAAAWAAGVGVGLLAFMVTWLIGNRLAALLLVAPLGPSLALGAAVSAGVVTTVFCGRRLARAPRGLSMKGSLSGRPFEGPDRPAL